MPEGQRARVALAVGAVLALPILVLGAWHGLHRISGLAPWVADSMRRVVGIEGVARLEEAAYGVEDQVNTVVRRGEKPRAYWEVPSEPDLALELAPLPSGAAGAPSAPFEVRPPSDDSHPSAESGPRTPAPPEPPFRPRTVGPMYAELDAPGDGKWVRLSDGASPGAPLMFKTLLHPDVERAWAELFVVAIELRRVRLYLVAGTVEPQATVPEAIELARPGRVPDDDHAGVVAAFNGGFKTEHGHYGMYLDGVTLVPPLPATCTIVWRKDGSLRIGTWSKLGNEVHHALWWRQTPDCMYENGKINPRLAGGRESKWGSAIDGETVIRRSAIGVDAAGTTLFVGISNHTTASAIARGMHHAGAATVAQLDINFSYPKFVTFRESPATKHKVAVPLAEGFEYSEHEYLRKASMRDFFYVMDSSMDGRTARN
jgi:hypothetical protein